MYVAFKAALHTHGWASICLCSSVGFWKAETTKIISAVFLTQRIQVAFVKTIAKVKDKKSSTFQETWKFVTLFTKAPLFPVLNHLTVSALRNSKGIIALCTVTPTV
jgi:hypothetical protein